jgi:ribosomal protein L7/L12
MKKIRITAKDRREYEQLKRNALNKVKRNFKKFGVDDSNDLIIPNSISDFNNREEFNNWKEQMKSFTSRSNMRYQYVKNINDVVASKLELMEAKAYTERAQKLAKEKIAEMEKKPAMQGGKTFMSQADRMRLMAKPDKGVTVPSDFNFEAMETRRELKERIQAMEKRGTEEYYTTRNEVMKQNFEEMLEKAFNSDADELVSAIREMSTEDFLEMYNMFEEFNFNLFYKSEFHEDDEDTNEVQKLMHYMGRYQRKEIDMDFKGI